MAAYEIVAHRGVPSDAPENTIPSFLRAAELGADAVEFDVRLTADRVPVVYHYFYLSEAGSASGAIFDYTAEQLSAVRVRDSGRIPTLRDVLEALAGRIGLEIEIKGPEPEAPGLAAAVLRDFRPWWDAMEVTSYEPALLLDVRSRCPGLATDLLSPRSEGWMKPDVIAYLAAHRGRLARARAVHLHPTQLAPEILAQVRSHGIEVHAWDVNDEQALRLTADLGIPRICTDRLQQALDYRKARAG